VCLYPLLLETKREGGKGKKQFFRNNWGHGSGCKDTNLMIINSNEGPDPKRSVAKKGRPEPIVVRRREQGVGTDRGPHDDRFGTSRVPSPVSRSFCGVLNCVSIVFWTRSLRTSKGFQASWEKRDSYYTWRDPAEKDTSEAGLLLFKKGGMLCQDAQHNILFLRN